MKDRNLIEMATDSANQEALRLFGLAELTAKPTEQVVLRRQARDAQIRAETLRWVLDEN